MIIIRLNDRYWKFIIHLGITKSDSIGPIIGTIGTIILKNLSNPYDYLIR